MVAPDVDNEYKKYISTADSCWEFGNAILYRMCQEYPHHGERDVIVGKIWLIGRSYAAAIERRKNADDFSGDEFYKDIVAPKMIKIGKELDCRLDKLKRSKGLIIDDLDEILSTHRFLMAAFYEITGLDKRSLASKYLHFHCPDKFFIYDSRARKAIGKIVQRPNKKMLECCTDYDDEYGDFACRTLELQEYLHEKMGVFETPRRLDSYLLNAGKQEDSQL